MSSEPDRDHSPDRDQSIDQLLRMSLRGRTQLPANHPCLDAETLAAWVDRTLTGDVLATAEQHLSMCAACQAAVATIVRITPEAPQPEKHWARGWRLEWLVPLTAAATAVALWFALPETGPRPPAEPLTDTPSATMSAPATTRPQVNTEAVEAGTRAKREAQGPGAPVPQTRERLEARQDAGPETPPGAQAAAAPSQNSAELRRGSPAEADSRAAVQAPATLAERVGIAGAAATADVASPATGERWRPGPGGALSYSADGGARWEPLATGTTSDLLAGNAPRAGVCWVVGRDGVVLLVMGGRIQRRPFPELIDLAAVTAQDSRRATVTASDGRRFRSDDGGASWQIEP